MPGDAYLPGWVDSEKRGGGGAVGRGRPTLRDAYVRSLLPIMMTATWGPAETSPSPFLSRHIKCCDASPIQSIAVGITEVLSPCAYHKVYIR